MSRLGTVRRSAVARPGGVQLKRIYLVGAVDDECYSIEQFINCTAQIKPLLHQRFHAYHCQYETSIMVCSFVVDGARG